MKRNIVYIAQFHETCGYSHAALGYLKSLESVLDDYENINFKILSVSMDPAKLGLEYHRNKTSLETLQRLDKYHFKDQDELRLFLNEEYECIWHMTSIMPIILKVTGSFFNNINANVEEIILGAKDNYHILAWETSTIPKEYKAAISNYNPSLVITPSTWNTKTTSKIANSVTVPHLIRGNKTKTEEVKLPFETKDNFIALSVSEWTNRKNFECLIRSFVLELGDKKDAYLIIKTSLPPGVTKEAFVNEFTR